MRRDAIVLEYDLQEDGGWVNENAFDMGRREDSVPIIVIAITKLVRFSLTNNAANNLMAPRRKYGVVRSAARRRLPRQDVSQRKNPTTP